MKAYVLSGSPVESRILANILAKQGINTTQVQAPDEIEDKTSDECVIFLDWDNPKLSLAQKTALCQLIRRDAAERTFVVGSHSVETELVQAVEGKDSYVLYKPIETEDVHQKVALVRKAAFSKMKLDARVINAFVQGVTSTFETMMQMHPVREKVYMLDPENPTGITECDISGVMGLSGDYHGSVVISLPVKLALKTTAKMLCEPERSSLDAGVRDCLGEIINIIAGQAKAALSSTSYRFALALPTVIVGKGHRVHIQEDSPTLVMVFAMESEKFCIQVNIRPGKPGEA